MDQKTYMLLQQQYAAQRKQLMWTRFIAVLCLVLVVAAAAAGLYLKTKLDSAFGEYEMLAQQVDEILTSLGDTADRLDSFSEGLAEIDMTVISEDLNNVSRQLSEIQWQSLAENIDETAVTAQESLEKAMQAIDELDIEGLNEAIEELHTVVEPLANIVKRLS